MTDRLEILSDLVGVGASIRSEGSELVVRPGEQLASDVVERLRSEKPRLIQILSGIHEACPECGGSVVRDRTGDGFINRMCLNCGAWLKCERDKEGKA